MRTLAISLALTLVAALPAAAQLTVDGIAWGTPVAGVRQRLEGHGWIFHGVDQEGDHVFGRGDGAELVATFDSAGVVGMELKWTGPVAAVRRRYRAMDDSLRRLLGPPTREENTAPTWERGGALLYELLADEPSSRWPEPWASLTAEGPGHEAEMHRRAEHRGVEWQRAAGAERPPDTVRAGQWHPVAYYGRSETSLDSLSIVPLGNGVYRARFMDDWWWSLRMMDGRKYRGEVWTAEVDCLRRRLRRTRTVRLFREGEGGVEALPRLHPDAWRAPAPGSPGGQAIRKGCALMRGR